MLKAICQKINQFNPSLNWMEKNVIILCRSGSHSYGTNIAESDEDFKGVAIAPIKYLFGSIEKFEQSELKEPDTVIYNIQKFFTLAMANNPNILELLYSDPSDHVYISKLGQEIMDSKQEFISKKIKHTFCGYSYSQLKRIKLHRAWSLKSVDYKPTRKDFNLPEATLIPTDQMLAASSEIKKELDKFQFDFMQELDEPTKIEVVGAMTSMLAELKITKEQHWEACSRKIGLSDNFIEIMKKEREYSAAKTEYDNYQSWKKNRNPVRAKMEQEFGFDGKHALHLIRLLRTCKETLATGAIQVKRPDAEELISIRRGAWSYDKLIDEAEKLESEINLLYKASTLRNAPDKEKLNNLCIDLVSKHLSK